MSFTTGWARILNISGSWAIRLNVKEQVTIMTKIFPGGQLAWISGNLGEI
jgi:hypothetical protein